MTIPVFASPDWRALATRLTHEACVCVQVQRHAGSVPREAGAWMLVFAEDTEGTIGGGHLELQAISKARGILSAANGRATEQAARSERFALGPSLGQCCGGVVWLDFVLWQTPVFVATNAMNSWTEVKNRIKFLQNQGLRLPTLALFGGGHVGRAIVQVVSGLPMPMSWIDSRDEIFPPELPHQVRAEHSAPVEAAVHDLDLVPASSRLLIMSFSHAEDLEICAAALDRQRQRADLSFIGLIGSKTKWATFKNRLAERGYTAAELDQITCPIGISGVAGKEPGVIAVAVAAQLLKLPVQPPLHTD